LDYEYKFINITLSANVFIWPNKIILRRLNEENHLKE